MVIVDENEGYNRRHEIYSRTTFWDYGQSHTTSSYDGTKTGVVFVEVTTKPDLIYELWGIHGRGYHREGAPAQITRAVPSGIVIREAWYRNGKEHREKGPAVTRRDKVTGCITYLGWYRNGKCVTARRFEKSCEPGAPKKGLHSSRPRAASRGHGS